LANAGISLGLSVLFNTKTQAPQLTCDNALDGEGRVIETTQPVQRDHNDWQLHRRRQVADKVI
jgi:hypothetical protein